MLTPTRIDEYLNHLTSQGASAETIRAYRTDLTGAIPAAADCAGWPEFDTAMANYITENRTSWAPKTTLRRIGTLRSFATWAGCPVRLLNTYRAPTAAPPQPHPIPEGIDGVLAMIRSSRNPRHRALCALTGLLGLRVDEAVRVMPDDIDAAQRCIYVRGKGDKARVVPMGDTAWRIIRPAARLATTNGTSVVRLTNRGARAAITRHARNAGLSTRVSSHDMRATFATAAYENTKDLRAVQELLGHSDAKTTQVYTKVSESAMRAAAAVA